ncbi:hypothetical protein ACFWE6_36250, partial [Streptomyces nigra]
MTAESFVASPAGQHRAPEGALSVPAPGGLPGGHGPAAGRGPRRRRPVARRPLWVADGAAVRGGARAQPA